MLFGQAASVLTGSPGSPVAQASGWLRSHARTDDIIVCEYGTLAVYSRDDQASLTNSRCFSAASTRWRERAERAPAFGVVTIPFVAAGKVGATAGAGDGSTREVDVFDPGWTMVPAFYDVLGDVPVQFVVTSESIEARLRSELARRDPGRELRVPLGPLLYTTDVDHTRLGQSNPIRINRGEAPRSDAALLPEGWWLANAAPRDQGRPPAATPEQVAAARRQVFAQRFKPFLMSLAVSSLKRGDHLAAANAARLALMTNGSDEVAIRVAVIAIHDGEMNVLKARDGATSLTRAPLESNEHWLNRVLTAWGVAEPTASQEVRRYLSWSRFR